MSINEASDYLFEIECVEFESVIYPLSMASIADFVVIDTNYERHVNCGAHGYLVK